MKELSISKLCIPLTIFMPIMLKLSDSITFNISISDAFMPVILFLIITHSVKNSWIEGYSYRIVRDYSVIYIIAICTVLSLNLLNLSMISDMDSILEGMKNSTKILINIVYFSIYVYGFKVSKEKFENVFVKTWTYTSVTISLLAIMGVILYSIGIKNPWSFYFRAVGTFNDPNLFATYLFISISIISIYNYKTKQNILGINLITNLVALLLTSSRGAIISAVVGVSFVILILMINGEIKKISSILIKIIVFSSVMILGYIVISNVLGVDILSNTFNRIFSMNDTIKKDSRIIQWISGIKLWCENPILGVGIGRFIDSGMSMGFTRYKILAHNTYITFLSELGIVGLIAFIWFPFMLLINLIRKSKNSIKNQVLIFSIIGVALSCMSLNLENFRCMWVFWAYCYYCTMTQKERKGEIYNDEI